MYLEEVCKCVCKIHVSEKARNKENTTNLSKKRKKVSSSRHHILVLCSHSTNATTVCPQNNVRHIKPFVLLRLHFPTHSRAMVFFHNAPPTIIGRIRPSVDGMAGHFVVPLGTHIVAGQVPVEHHSRCWWWWWSWLWSFKEKRSRKHTKDTEEKQQRFVK